MRSFLLKPGLKYSSLASNRPSSFSLARSLCSSTIGVRPIVSTTEPANGRNGIIRCNSPQRYWACSGRARLDAQNDPRHRASRIDLRQLLHRRAADSIIPRHDVQETRIGHTTNAIDGKVGLEVAQAGITPVAPQGTPHSNHPRPGAAK